MQEQELSSKILYFSKKQQILSLIRRNRAHAREKKLYYPRSVQKMAFINVEDLPIERVVGVFFFLFLSLIPSKMGGKPRVLHRFTNFGGWERRFTTRTGAIHNFGPLIHNLVHNFWQGNGSNGDLC